MSKEYWNSIPIASPYRNKPILNFFRTITIHVESIPAIIWLAVILIFMYFSVDKTISSHHAEVKYTTEKANFLERTNFLNKKIEVIEKEKVYLSEKLEEYSAKEEQLQHDIKDYILYKYNSVSRKHQPYNGEIDLDFLATEITKNIMLGSKKYNLPPKVILGIMQVESHFNPQAISNKGARGLLQVMYTVHGKALGLKNKLDLHKIEVGIDSGLKVYREYYDKTKRYDYAMMLYLGGNNPLKTKPTEGQEEYVRKVWTAMGNFNLWIMDKDKDV